MGGPLDCHDTLGVGYRENFSLDAIDTLSLVAQSAMTSSVWPVATSYFEVCHG